MAPPIRQVTRRVLTRPAAQAVVGGLVVAAVGGAFGWSWVCVAGLVLSTLGEPSLHRGQQLVVRALRTVSLGLTARVLLRLLAATSALAHRPTESRDVVLITGSALLVVLWRAGYVFTSARVSARRQPAVETRNIPLAGLDVPGAPPRWLVGWSGSVVTAVELFVTVPAALRLAPGSPANAIALLGAVSMLAAAVWCELAARRVGDRAKAEQLLPVVQRQLDELQPEVVLYFGDNATAVYQANMWLTTLERLPQRTVVVLRNRAALGRLGDTRLPVVCVPAAVDLMALDLSSVRVALYVANVGNNIHMLRVPGIRSAFIGHGDSDKAASFNPYSRVYSQVWVAGPAGRRRYLEAGVGVEDADVVEVGRPQLDGLTGGPRPAGHVPTVLYAPTWEGWDEAQAYSSLATHGLALAERVLAPGSGLRLLYRPHPFTGRRDPAVAEADRRIQEMIAEANRRSTVPDAPDLEVAQERPLAGIPDRLTRSIVSGQLEQPVSALEVEQARGEAEVAFWDAVDPRAHQVMRQGGPSLTSCFGAADVLVTDVSSVLSDWVATGRPYAVCNPGRVPVEEFLDAVPSARAGTIVDDERDVDTVLQLVRGELPDLRAGARAELRSDLLGPETPSAQSRFEHAVRELAGQTTPAPTDEQPLVEGMPTR